MKRDPKEFQTRRHQAIQLLEVQLSLHTGEPGEWLRMARIRLQQGREDDGLLAFEHALWREDPPAIELTLLEAGYPWGEGEDAKPASRLYAQVLAGADPPTIIETLQTRDPSLRTRTIWLLHRLLHGRGADPAELTGARTRLLATLDTAGLSEMDVPDFVRERAEQLESVTVESWTERELLTIRRALTH